MLSAWTKSQAQENTGRHDGTQLWPSNEDAEFQATRLSLKKMDG